MAGLTYKGARCWDHEVWIADAPEVIKEHLPAIAMLKLESEAFDHAVSQSYLRRATHRPQIQVQGPGPR